MWTLKTLIAICSIGVVRFLQGITAAIATIRISRGLVDRVQSDLRAASDLEHGNKQRDRYHNAQTIFRNSTAISQKGNSTRERSITLLTE